MTNQTNNTDNQELDLGQFSRETGSFFSKVNDAFFDWILFFKRNILFVIVLIVLGAGLGFYKDSTSETYEQKLFVVPNFGSVDYLYEEVENLSFKIKQEKEYFEKNFGLKQSGKIVKIKIEPVVEIYEFIDRKDIEGDDRKLQLFKLISESGDMKKTLIDKTTGRYYKKHVITITTKNLQIKEDVIGPLIKYFNANPYFLSVKDEYTQNLDKRIAANDTTIAQINKLLSDFSEKKANSTFYNDNTQLNEVITQKVQLTKQQEDNRIEKAGYSNIIHETGVVLNSPAKNLLGGYMKFIIPILFIIFFAVGAKFRASYKKHVIKRSV